MSNSTIVIIGGGASGALLATAIVRSSDRLRAVVLEPRERLGAGLAYSTECFSHVLNVPAARMSAFPGEPNHFVDWLAESYPHRFAAHAFVPRRIYGEYVAGVADAARRSAPERLLHLRTRAIDAFERDGHVVVQCSDGSLIEGSALVFATGNPAPAAWRNTIDASTGGRLFASAWERGALTPERETERVLLIGTGLTAVDAALGLRENGHRGHVTMISRRGLLPHEHRISRSPSNVIDEWFDHRTFMRASRSLRRAARNEHNWRATLDAIRPNTNAMWEAMPIDDKQRFLRRLMPYWSVHRHRMAPEIAQRLSEMMSSGMLKVVSGSVGTIRDGSGGLRVPFHNKVGSLTIEADRVINCTGALHDYRRDEEGLVGKLIARGVLSPSALGLGIAVGSSGAALQTDGTLSPRFFAMGPLRFGTLFETIAMPEIRVQAVELATHLSTMA